MEQLLASVVIHIVHLSLEFFHEFSKDISAEDYSIDV